MAQHAGCDERIAHSCAALLIEAGRDAMAITRLLLFVRTGVTGRMAVGRSVLPVLELALLSLQGDPSARPGCEDMRSMGTPRRRCATGRESSGRCNVENERTVKERGSKSPMRTHQRACHGRVQCYWSTSALSVCSTRSARPPPLGRSFQCARTVRRAWGQDRPAGRYRNWSWWLRRRRRTHL
jgi:hypothetical protein